jgi:hypothetical protein
MTDQLTLLLEEWKQNVALYIDQDKRGMERTKLFLTVHGGLLVFFGVLWKNQPDAIVFSAGAVTAILGFFFTFISQRMSRRAHAFIILRKTQAMLIESKIKNILAPRELWETNSGIITTFTREHVAFKEKAADNEQWQTLIEEVERLRPYASGPLVLTGEWKSSMGHLRWLTLLHYALFALWIVLMLLLTLSYKMSLLTDG